MRWSPRAPRRHRAFQHGEADRRLRRHARRRPRGEAGAGAFRAKAVLAIQFADLLEALEATPAILAHHPSAIEVMDRFILDHTKQSAALERLKRTFIDGDPAAMLCVEIYARHEGRTDAAPRGHRAGSHGAPARPPVSSSARPAAQAPSGPSASGAGPLDGDEGGREVAVVRRRHRGRPEKLRDYIDAFLQMIAGTARPSVMPTHRSGACT